MPDSSAILRRAYVQNSDGSFPVLGIAPGKIKSAIIAAADAGDNVVVAAVAGKKIRVLAYVLTADAAVNAKWRSNGTDRTGLLYLGAKGNAVTPFVPSGWFETVAGEELRLNLSGATAVGGHVIYMEE